MEPRPYVQQSIHVVSGIQRPGLTNVGP